MATKPYYSPGDTRTPAGEAFSRALQALRLATDSRGLFVRLHAGPTYTAEALRKSLQRFAVPALTADRVEYVSFDTPAQPDEYGAITWARNLTLLANAYYAALAYERAVDDESSGRSATPRRQGDTP